MKVIKGKGSSIYTLHFETFWKSYPKKDGKKAAFKSWLREVKSGVDPQEMIRAANNYAAYKKGSEYIKAASTFLNQEDMTEWQTPRKPEPQSGSKPTTNRAGFRDFVPEPGSKFENHTGKVVNIDDM